GHFDWVSIHLMVQHHVVLVVWPWLCYEMEDQEVEEVVEVESGGLRLEVAIQEYRHRHHPDHSMVVYLLSFRTTACRGEEVTGGAVEGLKLNSGKSSSSSFTAAGPNPALRTATGCRSSSTLSSVDSAASITTIHCDFCSPKLGFLAIEKAKERYRSLLSDVKERGGDGKHMNSLPITVRFDWVSIHLMVQHHVVLVVWPWLCYEMEDQEVEEVVEVESGGLRLEVAIQEYRHRHHPDHSMVVYLLSFRTTACRGEEVTGGAVEGLKLNSGKSSSSSFTAAGPNPGGKSSSSSSSTLSSVDSAASITTIHCDFCSPKLGFLAIEKAKERYRSLLSDIYEVSRRSEHDGEKSLVKERGGDGKHMNSLPITVRFDWVSIHLMVQHHVVLVVWPWLCYEMEDQEVEEVVEVESGGLRLEVAIQEYRHRHHPDHSMVVYLLSFRTTACRGEEVTGGAVEGLKLNSGKSSSSSFTAAGPNPGGKSSSSSSSSQP
ncbi:hypothetical protein HID58_080038, partial [Brassica napus]